MPPDPRILERNVAKLVGRSYRAALPKPAFRAALKDGVIALASEPRLHRVERAPARPIARWLAVAAGIALAALLWRAFAPAPAPESLQALLARGAVAVRSEPQGPWRAAENDRIVVPAASFLEVWTPGAPARTFTIEAIAGRCDLLASSHAEVATTSGGSADAPPLQVWLHAGHAQVETNARDRVVTKEGSITFGPGSLDVGYERSERAPELPRLPVRLRVSAPGEAGALGAIVDDATPPRALDATVAWMLFERVAQPWDVDAPAPADVVRREPQDATPAADTVGTPLDEPGLVRAHVFDASTKLPIPRVRVTLLALDKILADGRHLPAYGERVNSPEVDTDFGTVDVDVESHGTFKLFVAAPGHATWQSETFESATDAPARVFDVALEAGVSLSGFVTDAATGDAIADAIVFSETDTPALGVPVSMPWLKVFNTEQTTRIAHTDANGYFTLAHASRRGQRLRAMAPGRGAQILRFGEFAVGATRDDLSFELGPAGAITGHVLDTAGKPLANQIIVAVSQTQRGEELAVPLGFATSGDDGSYRLDELGPGLWIVIHMAASDPSMSSQRVHSARVTSGGSAIANFGGGAHVVRGTARAPDGTPLTDATLSLSHEDDDDSDQWIGVTTDSEGRFVTGLDRTGRYSVVLIENAGQRISIVGSFEVNDEPETIVDLSMPTGVISGQVLHAESGEPVKFAHVVVLETMADGSRGFAGHAVADVSGRFHTAPFQPEGVYSVVSCSSDEPLGLGIVNGVQVTAGQSASGIELRMPRGGSIVVAPQDEAGHAISGARVELRDARGVELDSDFIANVGALDEKRFAGVDAARWTVRVHASGFETFETTCDVPLGGEARVIARLVPAPK